MKLVLLIFMVSLTGCTIINPFEKPPTAKELKKSYYADDKKED
jgi:predicted small lipoprotein YifL